MCGVGCGVWGGVWGVGWGEGRGWGKCVDRSEKPNDMFIIRCHNQIVQAVLWSLKFEYKTISYNVTPHKYD